MQHSKEFEALVDQARTKVTETDAETVQKRRAAGEDLTLIDVRESDEFAGGHIPGAEHLSKGIIERDIVAKHPDKDAELILYCGGGYRSALAGANLVAMGYRRVISMDGGMRKWRELKYPEEK